MHKKEKAKKKKERKKGRQGREGRLLELLSQQREKKEHKLNCYHLKMKKGKGIQHLPSPDTRLRVGLSPL